MDRHILYGASGHAKVVLDAMEFSGFKNIALVDDNADIKQLSHYKVEHSSHLQANDKVILSIGSNKIRKKLAEKLAVSYFSVVHPKAVVAGSVELKNGIFIAAGAVINASTKIGAHAIINTSASIDHDCTIKDFVHVAPNATLCGGITVGEGTLIGAGATVLPNINIGKWATIAAGAVVTKDVPDDVTVVGNPAKQL